MSNCRIGLMAAVFLAAGMMVSHAQEAIPDLTGTWTVQLGSVILADGTVNEFPNDYSENRIEITKQTGSVFTATQKIVPKEGTQTGSHDGAAYGGKSFPMIGTIDGTGPYVMLADVGDTTVFHCTLVDEGAMRCLFVEAGDEAVAGFLLFKRDK